MDYSQLLNQEQLKGVTCTSKYTRIIAGAGSGKTRVLTYRIAYLITDLEVFPSQILGITFTNKAAKEIKTRVENIIPFANNMNLSTIHSFCAKFLRIYADAFAYPKNFSILDEEDQLTVMKNIFAGHDLPKNDPHIKECLAWIGGKKTEGLQYSDLEGTRFPNPLLNQFLIYFKEYTEYLRKTASLDFDDLLLKTIEVLSQEENGIRATMQRRIKHILVDEFQDINDVQFQLIRLLMGEDTSLYVVGDPDQTIYTWRGANNKIMLDLEENLRADYPDAEVNTLFLVNNYRSTSNILKAANMLITNNKERVPKDLFPINGEGEQVTFFNARTTGEEASYIVNTISGLVSSKGMKYNDFAVLYRSNYLTRELESQFTLHHVPYRLFGGVKFYQRREIKDVIAYLTLITNPDSDVSFERIINVPKRNIGPTSMETLKQEANEYGQTLYFFAKESITNSSLPKSKRESIKEMVSLIEDIKSAIASSKSEDYGTIIEKMLAELEFTHYLREDDNGDERIENVTTLIGSIKDFFKQNPSSGFEEFVTNAALQASSDEVNDGNYVSLMTVHIAKGLEFDQVFVYGCNEGVFPSQKSLTENKKGIEEERRLAYVAITRARKKLYLTCNQDYSYVVGTSLSPSRFLEEAGIKTKKSPYSIGSSSKGHTYISSYNNNAYTHTIKKPVSAPPAETNGITDWAVGDMVMHKKFGIGKVLEVSGKIIRVQFKDQTMSLMGSNINVSRLTN